MSQDKSSYQELEQRCLAAEAALAAIRSGQADLVIGDKGPLVVRLAEVEKALLESEEKYRGLIETIDSMVATVDAEGHFLYMNDLAAKQLGGDGKDFIGRYLQELFPEQIASRQMEIIRSVICEDKGHLTEFQSLVNGQPRWYRTSVQPIHDRDGRVIYALVSSTDISDLKLAQAELQDLNRTLEQRVRENIAEIQDLYDAAPAGYHSLDENGRFVRINQTELKWLGYSPEKLLGRSITDILTEQSILKFQENFPRFKQSGRLRDLELDFVRKEGTILPVLVNADAEYNEEGQYLKSRSTVFDNSEHKKAAETMWLANAQMESALRMKDEFLASMSHELRTPLTGILGFSEVMQLEIYGPLNDRQHAAITNIENSGHHLLDLINDILDVSKIEAGKLTLQIEPCNLDKVCQDSLLLVKGMAQKKGQKLSYMINPETIIVMGDERRLKQILANLLSNAVKYSPEGGSIGLDVVLDMKIVTMTVWDYGIGIAPADFPKLFRPFMQLDSSLSRSQTGTGLGLALVQRLVDLHRGSIGVESSPGVGSRFTVKLPALADMNRVLVQLSPPDASTKFADSAPSLHEGGALVVIVDDDEINREFVSEILRSSNFQVLAINSGIEFLSRLPKIQPDIVLMDIQMPVMNGFETISRLRAYSDPRVAAVPVIALTALAMIGDRERCLAAGANGYLSKPIQARDLMMMVLELLEQAKPNAGDKPDPDSDFKFQA